MNLTEQQKKKIEAFDTEEEAYDYLINDKTVDSELSDEQLLKTAGGATEFEEQAKDAFFGIECNGFICYGPGNWQTTCPQCRKRLSAETQRDITVKYAVHLLKAHNIA